MQILITSDIIEVPLAVSYKTELHSYHYQQAQRLAQQFHHCMAKAIKLTDEVKQWIFILL